MSRRLRAMRHVVAVWLAHRAGTERVWRSHSGVDGCKRGLEAVDRRVARAQRVGRLAKPLLLRRHQIDAKLTLRAIGRPYADAIAAPARRSPAVHGAAGLAAALGVAKRACGGLHTGFGSLDSAVGLVDRQPLAARAGDADFEIRRRRERAPRCPDEAAATRSVRAHRKSGTSLSLV
eukprot:2342440-Pleurochrysis_carterae.AAC.3